MSPFLEIFAKPHHIKGQPHFPTNYDGKGSWWDAEGVFPLAAGRGFNIHVVGESQWQEELATLMGGRCEEGHNCHMPAQLVRDHHTRDPNAVGVMINRCGVGWLPYDIASDVRAALTRLNPRGFPVTCKAKVVGGWDRGRKDRGYFGVKLSLALPIRGCARAKVPAAGQAGAL